MDYRLLRQFDSAVRKYYSRLKEIWVSEKYGRNKALQSDDAERNEYYQLKINYIQELICDLEGLEVPAYDFHTCRDNFLNAGKALQQAYNDFPRDADVARRSLAEYSYFLDTGLEELKNLWKRYRT